jgi:tetratricopeptide (TPR) repeat protein
MGRREEALSVWQELVAGDRRSSEAFRELSAILQAHGEQRAAIDALHAACDVLPTVPDLLRLATAQLEFREGNTRPLAAESFPVLTRAAAAAETFADWQRVIEQQAAALQQLGQLDDALQQFRSGPSTTTAARLPAPELSLPAPLLSQLQLALLELRRRTSGTGTAGSSRGTLCSARRSRRAAAGIGTFSGGRASLSSPRTSRTTAARAMHAVA